MRSGRTAHGLGATRRHVAWRALAYKWFRIIYRCWKTRTPYDDA